MTNNFQVCIFDDSVGNQLSAYQLTRPTYTVPVGYLNIVDKLQRKFPHIELSLICNKSHETLLKQRYPKLSVNRLNKSLATLYLNGRCNFSKAHFNSLIDSFSSLKNYIFIKEQDIIGIFCTDDLIEMVFNRLLDQPTFDDIVSQFRNNCIVENKSYIQVMSNWWDYLFHLNKNLVMDFNDSPNKSLIEGTISNSSTLINEHSMYIDKQSKICEYVSLDASNGPIYISGDVLIKPFVHIEGPCFIGEHSIINSNSSISSSFIANNCKIGGEVKNSIFQSFSNKAHYGFVGDSIVGEWVNLGAGTTTSNLKLTYGKIKSAGLYNMQKESNQQFLGTIFGDYVKTGIQSSFNCGSVISSGSSLFDQNTHATFVPPFSWGAPNNYSHHELPKFFESLERMMQRRQLNLSAESKISLESIYNVSVNQLQKIS